MSKQRKFLISYPDDFGNHVDEIVTYDQIVKEYYPYWSNKMIDKYGQKVFTERFTVDDCITDWVVVHWAKEL